jgi:hypothetical protein
MNNNQSVDVKVAKNLKIWKTKNGYNHNTQSGFGRFKKINQCSYWHPLFIFVIYVLINTFQKILYCGYSNCLSLNYMLKNMTCRVQNNTHAKFNYIQNLL